MVYPALDQFRLSWFSPIGPHFQLKDHLPENSFSTNLVQCSQWQILSFGTKVPFSSVLLKLAHLDQNLNHYWLNIYMYIIKRSLIFKTQYLNTVPLKKRKLNVLCGGGTTCLFHIHRILFSNTENTTTQSAATLTPGWMFILSYRNIYTLNKCDFP